MRSIAILVPWLFRAVDTSEHGDRLNRLLDERRADPKEMSHRLLATLQANIGKSYVYAKCVASHGGVRCDRMDARTSVMRVGRPGMGSVLVVTNGQARLESLAEQLAAAGYHAFAALPIAVPALVESMIFDLVIVLHDVGADDVYLALIREEMMRDSVPTIRSGDMAELIRSLRGNELDLVLCESEPPITITQGLETAVIETTVLLAVAPPTVHLDDDWQNVGLVQFRATSSYRGDVEAFLKTRGLKPRIVAESDDCLFLVEAAVRGGFVTIVPRSVARDAINAGRLRELAVIEPSRACVHALYLDGSSSELARQAVEVLTAHVKRGPATEA